VNEVIEKQRIYNELWVGFGRLLFTACALSLFWVTAALAGQWPSMAPVNPDYLRYQAGIVQGEAPTVSQQEHGLGYIPPLLDLSHTAGQVPHQLAATLAFPDRYDLRTLGRVTPVKDQGACNSCWAYGTYASLESFLMPAEEWDFSENNMKNSHGFDWGPCEGGNSIMSTAYLGRWSGPILEADDPYDPANDYSPPGLVPQKHVQKVLFLPSRTGPSDNDRIKHAVMTYGAVKTSIYWASDYYDAFNYGYYYYGSNPGNHCVAVVGWDDDYDSSNFIIPPPGDGAFLIKNSWGTAWGDGGYFYISYYDSIMGRGDDAVFQNAEPTTNYSSVYQYDPLGWVSALGYDLDTAWFANVFIAEESEQLAAVSFYSGAVNSSYEIYIYVNPVSPPVGSVVGSSESGALSYPGYHTIVLSTPVELVDGDQFSVVVKLTTPGFPYPIPIEFAVINFTSAARAFPGESFISPDGGSWMDATAWDPSTNVGIKAFTSKRYGTLVDLSGTIKTVGGTDICSMVLASGKYTFSCNPAGVFSLTDLPRENDGTVKSQMYADGFLPEITIVTESGSEAFVMTRSGTCPSYNIPYEPAFVPGSAGKRINITGKVVLQNSETPICAMVLANGQYMFSCDGTGRYALNIPLDSNGQFKLQVYADGFAPSIRTFDEFKTTNIVRMARAIECQ
jgi:C1A family cysteine protease